MKKKKNRTSKKERENVKTESRFLGNWDQLNTTSFLSNHLSSELNYTHTYKHKIIEKNTFFSFSTFFLPWSCSWGVKIEPFHVITTVSYENFRRSYLISGSKQIEDTAGGRHGRVDGHCCVCYLCSSFQSRERGWKDQFSFRKKA